MSKSCSITTNTIWSCITYVLLIFLFWTAAFTVGAWRYFVSEKEHKDRKRDKRVPCCFAGGWNTAFAQIFQTLNLNHFYRNQDRLDAYPGFISSQASSCPALGASTPVRIFPLSTWMTLTGRSLIWLVSSKGWERKGGKPKQQKIHIKNGRDLYGRVPLKWFYCLTLTSPSGPRAGAAPSGASGFWKHQIILVFFFSLRGWNFTSLFYI